LGNLKGRDHLQDTGLDDRIMLMCIFRKWDVKGCELVNVAQDRVMVGSCEHSNETTAQSVT
jgi:hypothetical protein